ncbi:MAG TPA: DoxX family protein [Bacillota bacterium]|nr:DoxX family protein [Bacillota bacterium]
MPYVTGLVTFLIRLYLGWEFLSAGLGKWSSGFGSAAVSGYLKGALAKTSSSLLASKGPQAAAHPDVTETWGWMITHIFLPNAGFFAFLVKTGEVLLGVALIVGLFTHLAAALGITMNFVYLLSGTASITGPMILGLGLIIVCGYRSYLIGLDRFLIPKLVAAFPSLESRYLRWLFPATKKEWH